MVGAETWQVVSRWVQAVAVVRKMPGRRRIVVVEEVVTLRLVGRSRQQGHVGATLAASGATGMTVWVQGRRWCEVVGAEMRG